MMAKLKLNVLYIAAFLLTFTYACNEPTDLASELVAGQFSDINFTDSITVRTLSTTQDSVFTFSSDISIQHKNYLLGHVDNPIFGTAHASIYADFGLTLTSSFSTLSFLADDTAVFDSLVLSIAYDSLRTYGDTLLPQNMMIYRLSEEIDNTVNHYSNESFSHFPTPIATQTIIHQPTTEYKINDTTFVTPHLRIHLDDALGLELMNQDSAVYSNNDNFQSIFKGIKIDTDDINSNFVGFNLASAYTFMKLYYTVDDTTHLEYTYQIGDLSVKYNEFNHDYSGSISEPFINNQANSDSLVFVQGMSGLNVKVDFPHIQDLTNIIVNKAEVEFTFAHLDGDDISNYYIPDNLVLNYLEDDGNYYFITDVTNAVAIGSVGDYFGGEPTMVEDNGQMLYKYRMNVSNYLQDIIDGNLDNNSIYLQIYLKNQYATRGVFYGGGHSQHPVKLYLTYTKI